MGQSSHNRIARALSSQCTRTRFCRPRACAALGASADFLLDNGDQERKLYLADFAQDLAHDALVVFEDLSIQAHSVVLASGTLAPTKSFRTNLAQTLHHELRVLQL